MPTNPDRAPDQAPGPATIVEHEVPKLRACPFCAEMIQPAARLCRFCQRDVEPAPKPLPASSRPQRAMAGKPRLSPRNPFLVALVVAIPALAAVLVVAALSQRESSGSDPADADREWRRRNLGPEDRSPQVSPDPPRLDPIRVALEAMWQDYHDNEVAADTKYKGKRVILVGFVNDFSSHNSGSATLWLNGTDVHHRIAADFAAAHSRQLAQLRKGKEVTVACTAIGNKWLSLTVDSCQVLY